MIAEIIFSRVAPSLAKAVFFTWLKDHRAEAASSMVDAIADIIPAFRDRNAAQRLFDAIGERLAENLQETLESEGTKLEDNSKQAVLLEVEDVFNKEYITSKLLIEVNLDPNQLADKVLAEHSRRMNLFDISETTLFERLVRDACNLIVDVANQLPSFNVRSIGEILRREAQLLSLVEELIRRINEIKLTSQNSNPERTAQIFEQNYRLTVNRKLDELELFGVDLSTTSRKQSLTVAYITLNIRQMITGALNDENEQLLAVDNALNNQRLLLVKGQAGSGKTTLVSWIAVNAATQKFDEALSEWNDLVPFFIPLRSILNNQFPKPEEFPTFIAPSIIGSMPHGWVHQKLLGGQAVLLIDGVDEISDRSALLEWLKDLIATFTQLRIIVTSRPSAIEIDKFVQLGFADAELMPMNLSDIYAFIDHWHSAISQEAELSRENSANNALKEKLKLMVRDNRAIRSLATNPLLCAMLCALNRDRYQHLPTDRIELYEACCSMLLERRDLERGIDVRRYPTLNYRQKTLLVQGFAYFLVENEWTEITRERAEYRLKAILPRLGPLPDVTPETIIQMLLERSGLLREPTKGQIDFIHRTFQEFFAAKEAISLGNTGVLLNHALDDNWREVFILSAGLSGQAFREELISGLIQLGDDVRSLRHHYHLLAVACLETAIDISKELRDKIRSRIDRLVPPNNMSEAKALASAGELAVGPLRTRRANRLYATAAAATVRALAVIGTPSALSALEFFVEGENRQTVIHEITRAVDYFDETEYARRILSKIALGKLAINNVSSAKYLTNIYSLTINIDDETSEFGDLGTLPNLRELNINHLPKNTNLRGLAGLSNLVRLALSTRQQSINVQILPILPNLNQLVLDRVVYLENLDYLSIQPSLRNLFIVGHPLKIELGKISQLNNLESLSLRVLTEPIRIDELSPASLRILSIQGLGQRCELLPSSSDVQIQALHLTGVKLSPVSFEGLLGLRHLVLDTMIEQTWHDLPILPNLTSLSLRRIEKLPDVSYFSRFIALEELSFRYLRDLKGLDELKILPNLKNIQIQGLPSPDDLHYLQDVGYELSYSGRGFNIRINR